MNRILDMNNKKYIEIMKKERKLVLFMAVMVLSITMFSCKNGNQSQQLQSQLDSLSLQDSVHQQDVNSMQDFMPGAELRIGW